VTSLSIVTRSMIVLSLAAVIVTSLSIVTRSMIVLSPFVCGSY
jgi:hypothetical protein